MRLLLLIPIVLLVGCSKGKKDDYTSETYYEKHARWYWSDKYVETIVAVPIGDRVEPAFLVERVLYEKDGEKHKEVKVKTVNLTVYEAADARRQKLLGNLFTFFRGMALLGTVAIVAGIILFALKFKFPALPSIWDEFLIYGGLLACLGMLGAWYVEEFITVSICGGAALVIFSGYSLIKHTRRERRHLQTHEELSDNKVAVDDIVATVEVLKLELGDKWQEVRTRLVQDPRTKKIVDELQESASKKARALLASSS